MTHFILESRPVFLILVSGLLSWLSLWLVPKLFIRKKLENQLLDVDLIRKGASSRLIVLIHGYGGKGAYLDPILKLIHLVIPDGDVFFPGFLSSPLCNSSPRILASHIEHFIDEKYEERKKDGGCYESVILIGHSLGGLLARQAYLYGHGQSDDPLTGARRDGKEWARKVDRLVLSAALNRGWSLKPKAAKMGRWTWIAFWLAKKLTHPSGTGRLLKSLERGSPFVADLRVDWIRFSQRSRTSVAPTYQLLGEIDNLVTPADNMDLNCCPNFIFIPVRCSGHGDILKVDDSIYGKERRNVFVEAITGDHDALDYKYGKNTSEMKEKMKPKTHIVFMMHGIRDNAEWMTPLRKVLEDEGGKRFGRERIEVISSKYGYFNMIRFLLFPSRESNVCWFMDQYTEALARSDNADVKVGYVGHSNGTFILTKALRMYGALNIHNAMFAGSVVQNAYPWKDFIPNRVAKLRNDLADKDWVVAWFPNLYAQICDTFKIEFRWLIDLGSAGFHGFTDGTVNQHEKRYKGGHGAALNPENFPSIAEYIYTGDISRNESLLAAGPNPTIELFSKFSGAVWLLLLGCSAVLGYLLFSSFHFFGWGGTTLSFWSVYYFLIFIVLYFA